MPSIDKPQSIPDCDICNDLADKAFEAQDQNRLGEIATAFLNHVISHHTAELMAVLAEKYGPIFMSKRALR